MKPILRIALASFAGLATGWCILLFRAGEPPPPPVPAFVRPAPPGAAKISQPEWRAWLEANSTVRPMLHEGAFWQRMPELVSCTSIEWELALEEAFFGIPPEVLMAVLADEKFARFPRLYEVEQSPQWGRKLLSIGLEEALGMAGKMPAPGLNAHLEHMLLKVLAKQDPGRGFEWLKESSGGDQFRLAQYLKEVAGHDVDKAGSLYVKLDPSMHRYAAGNLLKTLGSKDWRNAEAWGKQHLTPEEWTLAAPSVFEDYTGARIAALKKIGDETGDPALRSAAYSRWVFWPVASGAETLNRALALPAGSLNSEGWKEIASTCAMGNRYSSDPVAGAEDLKRLFQRVPVEARAAFQETVIRQVCLNDGPTAAQFYESMPPEQVTKLSNSWTRKDPAAASSWIATLPPSDKREAAVLAFCREVTSVDPAGAAAWALTVIDPTQRETAVHNALAAWRKAEPAAAEAWAAAKGITKVP
ncbi:MAG: hypothetical protein V4675_14410 [Verrucomicrobiota bacterium]